MATGTLKASNRYWLTSVILGNAALFWAFWVGLDFSLLRSDPAAAFGSILSPSGVLATISPLATLLLLGLLPTRWKERLVFWRLQNPLPGTRVFSHLLDSDDRIDPERLKNRIGPFPSDPVEQNRLWYRIYQSYDQDPAVLATHGPYLATRDMTALVAAMIVILVPALMAFGGASVALALTYLALMIVQLGIAAIAAQTYGNRFVLTVLAKESASTTAPSNP